MNKFLPMAMLLLLSVATQTLNAQIGTIQLGTSGNLLSVVEPNSTMLDANNTLNSVMFMHRSNPNIFGGGASLYRMDVSKNGGTTWNNNLGPLNTNAALDVSSFARYPQGIIFNPTGNTIADSGYVIYSGTYHDNVTWQGQNRGRGKLTGITSTFNSNLDIINSGHTGVGASLCHGAPGVFWSVNINDNTLDFAGTPPTTTGISVQKGVYSTSTRNVTWTTTNLPATFATNADGATICTAWNIAFDPTGQYGWISVLGDITADADSVYDPIFWKTTNGGTSWTGPIRVDLDNISGIKDYMDSLDANGGVATRNPSTTFDADLSVDVNGNPHLLVLVGSGTEHSVQFAGYEVWDITYSATATCPWNGTIFDKLYSLRGTFSTDGQTEDNRPQICRTPDGTKMFFFWTKTDVLQWSALGNDHPNLIMVGLDIPTGVRTPTYSITEGDPKWGAATQQTPTSGTYGGAPFTVISPTALVSAGNYNIPMVFTQIDYNNSSALPNGSSANAAAYFYANNITFSDADFIYFSDLVNPVITLNGANPLNLTVGQTYNEPGATATDCVDGSITPDITGTVNTNVAGTYTVQYVATDVAGNSDTVIRVVTVTGAGSACNPNANTTQGLEPKAANVNCITRGTAFSQVYTFVVPSSAGGAGITSITIDSIVNLPSGLTWAGGVTPATYAGGTSGCFTVSGTTNAPCGQYTMLIYVTVVTQIGTFSGQELSALAGQFGLAGFEQEYLRVIASGNSCPAVNTSPGSTFVSNPNCSSGSISVTLSQTAVSCFGQSTGSITATATGGSNYSYAWSNGGPNSATISNLAAGNYRVTVTSGGGQTATATIDVTQPSTALTVSANATATTCTGSTGTATATASGGTAGYTYVWSNSASGATISNLAAGTYRVTVTDSKGCTATASVSVSSGGAIAVSISTGTVNCFGGSTGIATANPTNNNGAVTYNWSRGIGNAATVANLSAGAITVTATDAGGCSASASAVVTQPAAPLSVTASSTNTGCSGNTGSVTTSVTGGTIAYTYLWSNSSTSPSLTNLGAGTYVVTVTDDKGCSATASATVTSPANFTVSVSAVAVTCYGQSTGSVTATVTGATGNINYAWNTGPNTASLNNQPAGTYQVTVTDGSGCSKTASGTITQPAVPLAVTVSTTNSTCGASTGSATATVTGNNGNTTYTWSGGNGGNTATISSLGAGIYNVTVTAGGCTATAAGAVNNSNGPTLSILQNNPTCFGSTNGSATAVPSGGQQPYSYIWNTNSTSPSITGVIAGTYTVIVTDNGGCAATRVVTLTQPDAITFNPTVTNVTCNGGQNGAASVAVGGGTGPYQYGWSNSTSQNSISNVAAGAYTLTVTDSRSCTAVNTVTITQPSAISVSASATPATCAGTATGTATASANGGQGALTYSWSNTNSGTTISNLTAGAYRVTVTDGNGCTVSATTTVTEPVVLTVAVTTGNGTATATPAGGNTPYTYNWNNSQTTATASGLAAGTATVTVTDNKGCTATASGTVVVSGIEEATLANTVILVYPNPASDVLNVDVELTKTHNVQLRVTDATGKLVYLVQQTASGSFKQPLNTATFAAGVYVLEVKLDNYSTYRRFVIGR
ncbi:MAG: DUF5011 domain-containing protein [Chitinophagales bacterium]|nr:DUF5011 domain-containing protein [Chitinophagales bacterium]